MIEPSAERYTGTHPVSSDRRRFVFTCSLCNESSHGSCMHIAVSTGQVSLSKGSVRSTDLQIDLQTNYEVVTVYPYQIDELIRSK